MFQLRKALTSRNATIAFRILFGLIAIVLIRGAAMSVAVLQTYNVQFGTTFWFVNALIIVAEIVGVVSILMMSRGWKWSVWIWAVTVLGVGLTGVLIGLDTAFLVQWHMVLPWIVLLASVYLQNRFATPWKGGSLGLTSLVAIGSIAAFGVGAEFIHRDVTASRNALADPLGDSVAETNQQLPMMVNDELRLDRVAVKVDVFHHYLTFPGHTAAELAMDPGLDVVRDHYGEIYLSLFCDLPGCQERTAVGESCGTFHYEMVDRAGEPVISFSLDGSGCRYEKSGPDTGVKAGEADVDSPEFDGEPVNVITHDRIDDLGGQTIGSLIESVNRKAFPKKSEFANCSELVSLIRGNDELELVEVSTRAVTTRIGQETMIYSFTEGDCVPE